MNNILHLKDNEIILTNGCYGLVFEVELPEKYSLGEQDYISLNEYWNKAIKGLPIGSVFFKQDVFLKKPFDSKHFEETNFLQKSTKNYFKGREYLEHKSYVYFICPSEKFISTSLTNPFKKLDKSKFDLFDEKIVELREGVKEVVGYLKSIKLQGGGNIKIKALKETETEKIYTNYFNLFDENFISDRFFENDYVKIGDKYANIIAMVDERKFPNELEPTRHDTTFANDKSKFFKNYGDNFGFELDFSHIYNQICFVDATRTHLNALKETNSHLHKSASFDKQNEILAAVTDETIKEITQNIDSVNLIRGHNNVIIISDTLEELKNNSLKVAEQFRDIDIKPYLPKGNYLNALFNYSFPFFCQYFTPGQLYVSSLDLFCGFINNCTLYKNNNKGIVYNSRLSNVPVIVDVWDEDKKYVYARNFFILAPTGSGKSVNANHLITGFYSQGVKIVIVDLGGSYKKVAALFPEDTAYITYEEGKSLGINPFLVDSLTTDVLEELIEFISIHYKNEVALSEVEVTSLRKILELYYSKAPIKPSLPHFVKWVKINQNQFGELDIKNEYFNVEDFLFLMSNYIDDGSYAFLYDENEEEERFLNSDIKNKSIVIFELDKAKDNKLLLSLMLQLVSSITNKIIWVDKSTRGIILYDEVAEQLKWDGVLRRIQYQFQAIRKQNGAVGMVLQSESQLPVGNLSTAIVENTQILYVLGAKDYRSLQKRFGLSEHAYYQLCSIQSNFDKNSKFQFSEMFLMRGNHHQIYRLELPKEVYWAYQTEGKENALLMERAEEIGMESAIKEIMSKEV
jgi:conjugal transfer ATP-binding protein TraC